MEKPTAEPQVADLLAEIASLRAQSAAATAEPKVVWIAYDHCDPTCDCDSGSPYCYGKSNISVFTNEQTARQEADQRSKRYGGSGGRPDMHMEKLMVSTKMRR